MLDFDVHGLLKYSHTATNFGSGTSRSLECGECVLIWQAGGKSLTLRLDLFSPGDN